MSSITESTSSYFVRNGPELLSSTLLLPTALFSGNYTSPFLLICSTSSLPFTTYLTDQTLGRCVHCLDLDKQPIRHSNFLKCRFIFLIFLNAWVCLRIIINIWQISCVLCSFSRIFQKLAVAVALCLMTGSNTRKVMNTNSNLRNGQNHASVSCIKQFQKQKCLFSFLRFSPEGRPVKMQVATSLPWLDVDIR